MHIEGGNNRSKDTSREVIYRVSGYSLEKCENKGFELIDEYFATV
jgi:hypothetical protein